MFHHNCICEEGNMPSSPNDIELLLTQIKLEVDNLVKSTEAKLLCHDGKIAELQKYIKDNLSNSIRLLLNDMSHSGELNKIITTAIINEIDEIKYRVVHVKDFNPHCNGIFDDRSAIQQAIDYASRKGLTVDLGNETYYVKSTNGKFIFDNVHNCKIKGFATIKIGDYLGDYEGVFNVTGDNVVFEDFTIDENTSNNPILGETGTEDKRRCAIYGWMDQPLKDIIIRNITFNDCVGVWQITLNGEHVVIENCTINYATNGSPKYDRTSIYMNGNDFLCDNNTLNGSPIAWTGIETHGNNMKVTNNYIKNFNSCIYVTNEWSRTTETLIDNILVQNNHCSARRGLGIWLSNKNINVDSIIINNNFLDCLTDDDVLYLYSQVGGGITCKTLQISNNTLKNDSLNKTHSLLKFYNTQNDRLSTVTIKNLLVHGNLFDGYCQYGIVFETQANNNLVIENSKIVNNIFNIGHLYGNQFMRITDTQFNFKAILFKNNEVKINGADNTITLFTCNVLERTENLDSLCVEDNQFKIGRGFVLCNVAAKYCLRFVGLLDVNLQHQYNQSFIHSGYLHDYKGQQITIENNILSKVLRASQPLDGSADNYFRTGDIIFNSNPVVGQPIGWMCISNPNNWRPMPNLGQV